MIGSERSESSSPFPTTQWTLIVERASDASDRVSGLEELCRVYWRPVYVYFCGLGESSHDAEDLTQGFFADFVSRPSLSKVDKEKGRFRSYLITAAKRFRAKQFRRDNALKRSPGTSLISIDASGLDSIIESDRNLEPEIAFDRQWAREVINHCFVEVGNYYAERERAEFFEALKGHLTSDLEGTAYKETARELGISTDSVKTGVARMRKRFRRKLVDIVAATLADRSEVEEEINYLFEVLRK